MNTCPWCANNVEAVATDPAVAEIVYGSPKDPKIIALNPLMCPECHGVGGPEDFHFEGCDGCAICARWEREMREMKDGQASQGRTNQERSAV